MKLSPKYYAHFINITGNKKTPKYQIDRQVGYYPQMDALKNKDGDINMYLLASRESGSTKDNAPAMRLQAKNGLNFTGLKEIFVAGQKGFAYGNPLDKETYGKDNKKNPFYECKDDCYLFIIHYKEGQVPNEMEMLVVDKLKPVGAAYCKGLSIGAYDEILDNLREATKQAMSI